MTLGYDDIRREVAGEANLTVLSTRLIIADFLRRTVDITKRQRELLVPELGTFRWVKSKPRRIKHPATKEWILLPATYSLKFRAAKCLRGVAR